MFKKVEKRFESIINGDYVSSITRVIRDKETGVNYVVVGNSNGYSITPLLNPDGTPVVTPGDDE